jgi:hypothetical protein
MTCIYQALPSVTRLGYQGRQERLRLSMVSGPLSDITVIDLTRVLAFDGDRARILADFP